MVSTIFNRVSAAIVTGVAAVASTAGVGLAADMNLKFCTSAGINPSIQPVLYAEKGKFFEKNGLKVELLHMNDSVTGLQAMLAGACDMVYTGAGTGMTAIAKSAPTKLVMSHTPWTEFVFIVQPEIKTMKDLEGKSVGISKVGALNYQATIFAFQQNGVDPNKVQLVSTGGNDSSRAAALVAKQIAGATVNALDGHRAIAGDPKLRMIYDVGSAFRDSFMGTAVFARSDAMAQKPEAVQAAVKALIESSRALQSDLTLTMQQAKASGLAPDAVEAVFPGLINGPAPYYGVDGGLNRKSIESTLVILKDSDAIEKIPTYEQIVEPRFVDAAVKELGAYKK